MSPAALHSAGAVVRHVSPFSELEVPARRYTDADDSLIEQWIRPLYIALPERRLIETVYPRRHQVDLRLVRDLLSIYDWRPRSVGALLAALRMETATLDQIGRLLLRSDVCFAGNAYCFALARMNTPQSFDYLARYLDYYLTHPELRFDQRQALAAVHFLDQVNGTAYAERWQSFVGRRRASDRENTVRLFSTTMATFGRVAAALGWAR